MILGIFSRNFLRAKHEVTNLDDSVSMWKRDLVRNAAGWEWSKSTWILWKMPGSIVRFAKPSVSILKLFPWCTKAKHLWRLRNGCFGSPGLLPTFPLSIISFWHFKSRNGIHQAWTILNHSFRGEAQRIKLAKELVRPATGKTLYIFDEPTTGLHFHDIKHLLEVLQELVERGNTVLVIEHNMDIVKPLIGSSTLGQKEDSRAAKLLLQELRNKSPFLILRQDVPCMKH